MTRTDEAFGVGGTGASEWSEPTKSSSTEFRNFIPEASRRSDRQAAEYEREREEAALAEPELTRGGDVPMPDVLLDDPESFVVDDPDELARATRQLSYSPGPKKRGRKKGSKVDPAQVAVRRAAFSTPISSDDISKLAAEYGGVEAEETVPTGGPTPAELAAIEREQGGFVPSRPTRGSAGAASDVQAALAKQARAKKRDPRSLQPSATGQKNPAIGYRPDPNVDKPRWPQMSSWSGEWLPWTPEKAGFIKDETGLGLEPDELDLLSRHYELEDEKEKSRSLRDFTSAAGEVAEDEQDHPAGAFVYDDPSKFQSMQPVLFNLLSEKGVDPNSGTFMRLGRKFKCPKPPAVLDPESSEFSAEKYFEYVYKQMSYDASRMIPYGSNREWTFFFPETIEPGDINGVWMFNPGFNDWQEITPEVREDARANNEEARAEDEARKRGQAPKTNWWEREVDPQGEWVDMAGLDPTQAAEAGIDEPVGGVGSMSGKEDEFTPPEDDSRWQPHPDYPGRFWDPETGDLYGYRPGASNWQRKQMAKGVKVSDLPSHAAYDIDPDEKQGLEQWYKNIYGEGYTMKIGEFFGLMTEAHGERAEQNSRRMDIPDGPAPEVGPDIDDFEDELGDDEGFGDDIEGGDMFQNRDTGAQAFIASDDPTSSQGNPEHTDIPGGEGGNLSAPAGVFQGTEGFGEMDEPMNDNEEDFLAGGPDDPEVAGLLPDPDFGSEASADDPAEMRKQSERVDFPEYEFQKYSGQRGREPSPEKQARRPKGWGW